MLSGGEEDALFHEAGGITDARDIVAVGLDRKIVEVYAAEDNAGVWRRGLKAELGMDAGVETHTLGFYGALDGGLEHWAT